jgi:uncharacterized protein (TIGR03437 family)
MKSLSRMGASTGKRSPAIFTIAFSIAGCLAPIYAAEYKIDFARPADRQAGLARYAQEVQDPRSPNYHRWLTPDQFAERFGLSKVAEAAIAVWIESSGLKISYRSRSRTYMLLSGDVDATTLKAPLHVASYIARLAPSRATELRPIAKTLDPKEANAGNQRFLAPDDYATIFNFAGALARGIDGRGRRIAIVGASNLDPADLRSFKSRFNLNTPDPEFILYPGSSEPGQTNDGFQTEANLDVQWASAVARGAHIRYVYGADPFNALLYAIDQNLAPLLSVSFVNECEGRYSQDTLDAFRSLALQAVAQGMTWINGSGDNGPAACDYQVGSIAEGGFALAPFTSLPEVTVVGGTELNDAAGNYWAPQNTANGASALSYIPEIAWNQSRRGVSMAATGGGSSVYYPKPNWQTGQGVPESPFRLSPDVALPASTYIGYQIYDRGRFTVVGGTSAGTPAFAGMAALLLQGTSQERFGNMNRTLYPLAQSNRDAFHDIVDGNAFIPCVTGTKDCPGTRLGFPAGLGYDLATGLGSVDFERLLAAWPRERPAKSLVTFSVSGTPVYATTVSGSPGWANTLSFFDHNGAGSRLTSLSANGSPVNLSGIADLRIPADDELRLSLTLRNVVTPLTLQLEATGSDADGSSWSRTLVVPYLAAAASPVIGGIANGASFARNFSPGAVLSIFGTDLAEGTQVAGDLPLREFVHGTVVTVNNVFAPFYFASPGQLNVQIPYSTREGSATLVVQNPQRAVSASLSFNVSAQAPGIFTNGDRFTVPQTRCGRGATCILFLTGQGAVSPAIATGEAPTGVGGIASLPKPTAATTMTIGGVEASVLFAGIPPALVGVTQINFTVSPNTPLGTQPVIVRIGGAASEAARIEIF